VAEEASERHLGKPNQLKLPKGKPNILPLTFSLLTLNFLGYFTGFTIGKILKYKGSSAIYPFTVGMKEFGVGTAVTLQFFGAEAAIPSAIYGIIMLLTAPALIKLFRR
jgi:predicted Na+-dependent transporter